MDFLVKIEELFVNLHNQSFDVYLYTFNKTNPLNIYLYTFNKKIIYIIY